MKKVISFLAAFLFWTALWQAASILVDRPFFPGPSKTAAALISLAADGKLKAHLNASFFRIVLAVAASSIPAAILGIIAGRSRHFGRFASPIFYFLHPLPKAAFLPVIVLFFGLGEMSKIFLVGFIIFSPVFFMMRDAAGKIPDELVDAARVFGAGDFDVLRYVILPGIYASFWTSLRVSLGAAIGVLFTAETFAAKSGLGYLVLDAWMRISYSEMYAAILALSLIALVLFGLTALFEFLLSPK